MVTPTVGRQLSQRERRAMRRLSVLGLAALALFAAHAGLGLWPDRAGAFQALYVCLYLIPAVLCMARATVVRRERRPWALFGLGMVALAAGYTYYFLVLQDLATPPSPSPSDALWFCFYAASALAVLELVRSRVLNAPKSVAVDVLIGALTLAAIAAALLVDPIRESTGGSLATVATNLAYPLFNLLIIALVVPIFVFSGWPPGKEWWLIGLAFSCQLVFDTIYLYKAANGTYVAGALLEAVFPAIMLLIAYAAWLTPDRSTAVKFAGWPTIVVPSLFVGAAVALTTHASFQATNDLAVILATGVLVLAVVRLAISFAEFRSLARSAELERQLQQSQRLEGVGQLVGGIAHDFNNLLAVILNYTSLVREDISDPAAVRRDVEEIHRAAERGAALTRQLLTFSRRDVINPELVDLNAVVFDLDKLLRHTLGEHLELRTRLAADLPAVKADRGQLEQVVLNLAVNARDAMPDGGTLTIETAGVDERINGAGTGIRLRVGDTGHGMSKELAARAFEPYFSTKPRDKGSGLGLSIVYGIVAGSGGLIELRSEPNRGTVVEVTWPAAQTSAAPTPTRRDSAPRRHGRDTTILLVEDEPAVREVTRRILVRHGHEVLVAGSAEEALRVLSNHGRPLGLLLTDVVIPGMSGKELADRIKETQPHLGVLYMSGYNEEIVGRHAELKNGARLLRKPFAAELLLASVQGTLARSDG